MYCIVEFRMSGGNGRAIWRDLYTSFFQQVCNVRRRDYSPAWTQCTNETEISLRFPDFVTRARGGDGRCDTDAADSFETTRRTGGEAWKRGTANVQLGLVGHCGRLS